MNKHIRVLALFLLLAITLSTLLGCPAGAPAGTSGTTGNSPSGDRPSDTTANYTVTLKSIGGMPLASVGVYVYTDASLDDLEDYKATDKNGSVTFTLKKSDTYHIKVAGVPTGYQAASSYPLTGANTLISLGSRVIEDDDISDVEYAAGDIMHDFTVKLLDGSTFTLSEVLKTKRAVLINFWYSECDPCKAEIPYMQEAYEAYKDSIEIVALNHYGKDTEAVLKNFVASFGMTFPVAKDTTDLAYAFGIDAYPTSIIVDRYGMICVIEKGGITSVKPFNALFTHFSAENYEQKIITDIEQLVPAELPNKENMPTSDDIKEALGATDLTVSFHPEEKMPDAEMSWPFRVGEGTVGGTAGKYVYPSNIGKDNSYATLYANIELKAGDVLAFDYFASTEFANDVMVVLIDRKDIYQISGDSAKDGWQTCYPFVAIEDGTYELALCYVKDEGDNYGDDTVYLRNLRVVSEEDMTSLTYIPRYAATHPKKNGFGYDKYVEVVLGADGYYHVGDANGPILLADLMGGTHFSNDSLFMMAYNGAIDNSRDWYEDFVHHFTLASNSAIYGLCSVDEELAALLKDVAAAIGLETENPLQWLQMCVYYNVYGPNAEEIADPVKGLSTAAPFRAQLGDKNTVTYDRVIMPRGLLYEFIPEKSGVYRITSHSESEVEAWIFLADMTQYTIYDGREKLWTDAINCSMVAYMEAGTPYYINIAYYDLYEVGSFTFSVEYLGESYEMFRLAAPGYFTYEENEDFEQSGNLDDLNSIIALGIDVVLHTDGYYHELREDGSVGSVIYADFTGINIIFSHTLAKMIENRAFDFRLSEDDLLVLNYLASFEEGSNYREEFRALWGEEYDANMELYKVEDVVSGIYHGPKGAEDMTDVARKYLALIEDGGDAPERKGCVAVTEELAEVLQLLMDKYTFEGVENSWLKLCYYYHLYTAPAAKEA